MNTGICKGLDAQSWKDLTEESFGNMPVVTVLESPFPFATTAIPVFHADALVFSSVASSVQ